ncbi:EAL domain, c-di-GMP-specific phosphodiesterase class I (or its enzymatically inactive variant) [Psychrobacillus sp. OK028]|uniref:EAL domain-containing protein n=1 Tax=Psychrobacillus sp. OK028 TaxID=1884359 RepID=UPI00088D3AA9|nr:EAL domain-containing protein [Psychrobacillus sp. OK028]SDN88388.1 EAL domain, c-di-GMP-specific phosphodiesterase class I (or its enzymatically inactive variant) [Psychrobacillus sp. OK028]
MECNNCQVNDLKFEFKVDGDFNTSLLDSVLKHLKRRNILVDTKENKFILSESDVRDFIDFCEDHMDTSQILFRISKQRWEPITKIEEVLKVQWIDEVIAKQLMICHYQPIVNRQEQVFGYELLARFPKEDGSMIYPNEIFSAAKARGRLYALDRACRMTAVKHAAVIKEKKAFINFIPTSIYSPEFCLKSTTALAEELGINPVQLVFEVVESEKVEDIEHLKRILTFYKEKGFEYALDDVGEGYSTMEMLGGIKPNYMKLDMKYVQGVSNDIKKQAIAQQFLEKAVEVGSTPLAEGIEEREDFEWLKETGYRLFQGYYFGKPAANPLS